MRTSFSFISSQIYTCCRGLCQYVPICFSWSPVTIELNNKRLSGDSKLGPELLVAWHSALLILSYFRLSSTFSNRLSTIHPTPTSRHKMTSNILHQQTICGTCGPVDTGTGQLLPWEICQKIYDTSSRYTVPGPGAALQSCEYFPDLCGIHDQDVQILQNRIIDNWHSIEMIHSYQTRTVRAHA